MISDIIKALDLLLKVIRGRDSRIETEKKKEMAKSLLGLHLSLDDLVSTGNELLDEIEGDDFVEKENWFQTSVDLIRRQLQALQSIADRINAEPIHSILKVYIPQVADIPANLEEGKGVRLSFLLAALTDIESATVEELEVAEGSTVGCLPIGAAVSYASADDDRTSIAEVYAIPQHICEGRRDLVVLRERSEQLRRFIVESFEIADLL